MGGLVCCVKPGDRELVEAYARSTGRSDSVIVVSPSSKWRCNLIRYALKRPGITGSRIEQLVSLLTTIVEAAERGERGGGQGDKFWGKRCQGKRCQRPLAPRPALATAQLIDCLQLAFLRRTLFLLLQPFWAGVRRIRL